MTVWFWGINAACKPMWQIWRFVILCTKKKNTISIQCLRMQITLGFMNNDKHRRWANTRFQPQRGKGNGNSAKETTFKARRRVGRSVHGLRRYARVSDVFKEALFYSWVTFQAFFTISLKRKNQSGIYVCLGLGKVKKCCERWTAFQHFTPALRDATFWLVRRWQFIFYYSSSDNSANSKVYIDVPFECCS